MIFGSNLYSLSVDGDQVGVIEEWLGDGEQVFEANNQFGGILISMNFTNSHDSGPETIWLLHTTSGGLRGRVAIHSSTTACHVKLQRSKNL